MKKEKGRFKGQKMSDGRLVEGYYLESGSFSYIVEKNELDNIPLSGENEVKVTVPLIRVLSHTVEKVNL